MSLRSVLFIVFHALALSADCDVQDGACTSDAMQSSSVMQIRRHANNDNLVLSMTADERLDLRKSGAEMKVQCDPQCHDVDQFLITMTSKQTGRLVYNMTRNRDIVTKYFHIGIVMPDGTEIRKKMPERHLNCHYQGDNFALSTCDHFSGHVTLLGTYFRLWEKPDGTIMLGGPEEPLPHSNGTSMMLEYEAMEDYNGSCGDGIVDDGEECDGEECCTSECKFATSGTQCFDQTGPCNKGGACSGSSGTCVHQIVRNGVSCGGDGHCWDGFCLSRTEMCKENEFHDGACEEEECDMLHCKYKGECVKVDFDVALPKGLACVGDASKVCSLFECVDASTLQSEGAVMFDALVPYKPKTALMQNTFLGYPTTFVAANNINSWGYNHGKLAEFTGYWAASVRSSPGLNLQPSMNKFVVLTTGQIDSKSPSQGMSVMMQWYKANKGRTVPHGTRTVAAVGGVSCSGGIASGCGKDSVSYTDLADVRNSKVCCDNRRNFGCFGFPILAHELGHTLGMGDLQGPTLPPPVNGLGTFMGHTAQGVEVKYHQVSVTQHSQRWSRCAVQGHWGPSGGGGGGDTLSR